MPVRVRGRGGGREGDEHASIERKDLIALQMRCVPFLISYEFSCTDFRTWTVVAGAVHSHNPPPPPSRSRREEVEKVRRGILSPQL